jgi:hypothetical protein
MSVAYELMLPRKKPLQVAKAEAFHFKFLVGKFRDDFDTGQAQEARTVRLTASFLLPSY